MPLNYQYYTITSKNTEKYTGVWPEPNALDLPALMVNKILPSNFQTRLAIERCFFPPTKVLYTNSFMFYL